MNTEPQLSLIPTTTLSDQGNSNCILLNSTQGYHKDWIVDFGATNHMTFSSNDFVKFTQPRWTKIADANGVTYPITGARTVALSPSLSLSNTLLVPSLSKKLLFVSQAIEELNCVDLMYPTFCLFQDILTKEIIGRGTKREGLYYMDDFNSGRTNNMQQHSISAKEKQIWLWHHRLGHPSFSYLKHLFSDLFSEVHDSDFKCDTCILAKSHRVPFPISFNKSDIPFALIHSDVWRPSPITTISDIC